jgi:ankyrin repeat protein
LERGADPNELTDNSSCLSAWNIASSKGFTEIAALLLQYGADPIQKNDRNHTALHRATIAGNKNKILSLLEGGVDPNEKMDMNDRRY